MPINILPRLAETKIAKSAIHWATKPEIKIENNKPIPIPKTEGHNYEKLQKVFPTIFLLINGTVQSYFLYKSKEMPKEKKSLLILNIAYSSAMALLVGMAIDKHIDNFKEKLISKAEKLYSNPANILVKRVSPENLKNGIRTAVPFAITAFLFEYIGPVIATPMATQTTNWLVKKGIIKLNSNKK